MPAVSRKQQIAIRIAENRPDKLYARNKSLLSMKKDDMHDFASGPTLPGAPKPPSIRKRKYYGEK